ncbi:MAG TPA: hypothetical protein VGN20_27445 [Mucilaginibacter sp.]|jgi:hypothetical protein
MPQPTFANIGKTLSVFADIGSIIYLLSNIKNMSWYDPSVSVLFFALFGTLLFFLVPFLWTKMITKTEKIMCASLISILSLVVLIVWINVSRGPIVIPKKTISLNNASFPKRKINDTMKLDDLNSKPIYHKKKESVKIEKPITILKRDRSKKEVKKDNSITVQGDGNHIVGGEAKVDVNGDIINGLRAREVTKELLDDIIKHYPDKNSSIGILRSALDDESLAYEEKLFKALKNIGYSKVQMGGIKFYDHKSVVQYTQDFGMNCIVLPENK